MTHLVTATVPGAAPAAALLLDGQVLLLGAAESALGLRRDLPAARDISSLFEQEASVPAAFERLRRLGEAASVRRDALREDKLLWPMGSCRLGAPLRPQLVVCSGNTYARHAREMGGKPPSCPGGFLKSPHCVIGPGAPIELPQSHPEMVDIEAEFALVVGRACHRIDAAEAAHCIAGYTLVNDVSARDWVDDARRSGDMFFNALGKQFPTFCPLGPAVVTADALPDVASVRLASSINGSPMQETLLSDLLFTPAEILAFWSRWYAFHPGDVVTTGTPPGVGFARTPPVFLAPGDHVTVSASVIGVLENPVAGSLAPAVRGTTAERRQAA